MDLKANSEKQNLNYLLPVQIKQRNSFEEHGLPPQAELQYCKAQCVKKWFFKIQMQCSGFDYTAVKSESEFVFLIMCDSKY